MLMAQRQRATSGRGYQLIHSNRTLFAVPSPQASTRGAIFRVTEVPKRPITSPFPNGRELRVGVLSFVAAALDEPEPHAIASAIKNITWATTVLTLTRTALTHPNPDIVADAIAAINREALR
jgi:hypothetical protein